MAMSSVQRPTSRLPGTNITFEEFEKQSTGVAGSTGFRYYNAVEGMCRVLSREPPIC